MDSLTQAVLGAAVYGAGMGKYQKRKSLLIGACLGTLPDLDVLIRYDDPISSMTFHRGFSHSLFLLTALALVITWLVFKRNNDRPYSFARLFTTLTLALVTHPIIDAMTMYGTQLWYPFNIQPTSWATVFIIDPIYTLPLVLSCLIALVIGLTSKTIKWLHYSVIFGFLYFGLGFISKAHHEEKVAQYLQSQGIELVRTASNPTPLNTVLWRVFGEDKEGNFYEAYSGYFDKNPPEFSKMPLNRELSQQIWQDSPLLQRLDWFTDSWLHYAEIDSQLVVTDMRMGYAGNMGNFRFIVAKQHNGKWQAIKPEQFGEKEIRIQEGLFQKLWLRIKGEGSLI